MEKLVTICGPRGTGKNTIIDHLLQQNLGLTRLVNFTTRKPRPNETEGIEYYFISKDQYFEWNNNDELACHSQIGKDTDPNKYFNGITKSEMNTYSIGLVDKAVESARKLEQYSTQILKLYIYSSYDERLQRIITGRNLSIEKAVSELTNEPSPGARHQLVKLYPDFLIIENPDGQLSSTCEKVTEFVKLFLGW